MLHLVLRIFADLHCTKGTLAHFASHFIFRCKCK